MVIAAPFLEKYVYDINFVVSQDKQNPPPPDTAAVPIRHAAEFIGMRGKRTLLKTASTALIRPRSLPPARANPVIARGRSDNRVTAI